MKNVLEKSVSWCLVDIWQYIFLNKNSTQYFNFSTSLQHINIDKNHENINA